MHIWGIEMLLQQAETIAREVIYKLEPYCARISVAGSVRRKKPVVKDIEIVLIPHKDCLMEYAVALAHYPGLKGELCGKYTKRRHPSGINLDIFMATPNNWGLQLAIRTGSAQFSHRVLATGWSKKGYVSKGGILYPTINICEDDLDYSNPIYIREEKELFDLIGITYIKPEERE